jgi:hypothetical protein
LLSVCPEFFRISEIVSEVDHIDYGGLRYAAFNGGVAQNVTDRRSIPDCVRVAHKRRGHSVRVARKRVKPEMPPGMVGRLGGIDGAWLAPWSVAPR